jgi:hypothetical protein
MAKCWEQRGCDEEMQANCAHPMDFKDNCPTKCAFANSCPRPSHVVTSDPELIFSPDVDRNAAVKDTCMFCEFFLKNGPRVA